MDIDRQETPGWEENDCCQKCDAPFFWNVRKIWESKTMGVRQVRMIEKYRKKQWVYDR